MKKLHLLVIAAVIIAGFFSLNVDQGQAANCVVKSAKWDKTQAYVGEAVGLTITGSDCAGFQVAINIIRKDDTCLPLVECNPTLGTDTKLFDSNGVARGGWTVASGQQNGKFYIIAGANNTQANSLDANQNGGSASVLTVSANPPGGGGGYIWACVADNNKYSCNSDPAATATDCSMGNTACAGKTCVRIPSGQCSLSPGSTPIPTSQTGQVSACIGSDNKYTCDTSQCSGRPTTRIDASNCGVTAVDACIGSSGRYNCDATECSGKPTEKIPQTKCGEFPGGSANYKYEIKNPLVGGPTSPFDILNIATKWLLNISIPLAVIFLLYAGFLMLTAGPNPGKVKQARTIILNVVLGLAIIFIGRGFITLIYSIIELGGTAQTTQCVSGVCSSSSGSPGQACASEPDCLPGKGPGGRCTANSSCKKDLVCGANNICQYGTGNTDGGPCLSDGNCKLGLKCDSTRPQQVDGQTVGTCVPR